MVKLHKFNELDKLPQTSEADPVEHSSPDSSNVLESPSNLPNEVLLFDEFDYDLWVSSDIVHEWMIEKYRHIKRQITSVLLENNCIPTEILDEYNKLQGQPQTYIYYVLNSFLNKDSCSFFLKTYAADLSISKFYTQFRQSG